MVAASSGYFFCHAFDLGSCLLPFNEWISRDSLQLPPRALRYNKFQIANCDAFVNELGFIVVLQRVRNATSLAELYRSYDQEFDGPYNALCQSLSARFGKTLVGDISFILYIGSQQLIIDWRAVHTPNNELSKTILVEAVFIDILCRALKRTSTSFMRDASIASDRQIVEYAESLFPLVNPASYLVDGQEVKEMEKYYLAWRIGGEVETLRTRFSESVANTSLYRGHLERNRQSALNSALAAIAAMSLAQVSTSISEVLKAANIVLSDTQLNRVFASVAVAFLVYGCWKHIAKPRILLALDDLKRVYYSRKL